MRGDEERSDTLFFHVSCEARVPLDLPLRPIRAVVDEALEVLSPEFERLYLKVGRPSIPPGDDVLNLSQIWAVAPALVKPVVARQSVEPKEKEPPWREITGAMI